MDDLEDFVLCAHSRSWGCQGRRTGVGVTIVSNSLILGGVGDKSFKELRRKIGGWEGGCKQYFDFYVTGSTKKCHFKKLHFGQFFLFVFVEFRNS